MEQVSKVILDDSSLWALLRLAYREGLVSMKPGVHLAQLTDTTDQFLEMQVLEQLVLTPYAVGFFDRGSLCEDVLTGPFLEDPHLTRVETPKETDQIQSLPHDMIAGILRARRVDIPEGEYLPRLQAALGVFGERQEREREGHAFPDMGDHMSKILGNDRLSEKDWDFYRRYDRILSDANPIIAAINHAQEVFTAAAEHSAHGMTPYATSYEQAAIINPSFNTNSDHNGETLTLIRVVAREVGTLLPQPSLAATLKLAESSEARALRHKSQEWISKLESGELGSLDAVRTEIRKAISSLEKTKGAKAVGSFVTLVAVPVGIAELCVGSPGFAGLTLSAIGTVAEVSVRVTEKRYRWARFGRT